MTINDTETMTINQNPTPGCNQVDSGQNNCQVTTVVSDIMPSKNRAPKKAASPTLPITHQPLIRDPRFFPHNRTHFATSGPHMVETPACQQLSFSTRRYFARGSASTSRSRSDSAIPRNSCPPVDQSVAISERRIGRLRHRSLWALTAWIGWLAIGTLAAHADWPQILGPNRDGSLPPGQTIPVPDHPAPGIDWSHDVGAGYAGPSVTGSQVLIAHRRGESEMLEALDVETGQPRWRARWQASYAGGIDPDTGPRCTPVVAGDRAIVYGAAGDLVCIQLADGEVLWHRRLRQEYRADDGYFGAGSTPLVLGDIAIVNIGGKDAGIAAIDLADGHTRWTATTYDASYASPVAVPSAGVPLALVVTRLRTVLLECQTGQVLDEFAFGSRGPTVNAATPIPIGDQRYLLTASYGIGTTIVRVQGRALHVELERSQLLASQYNTPVFAAGRVLGVHGREDVGLAALRAVDPANQRVVWEEPDFGTAHLLTDGQTVLGITIGGAIWWIDPSSDRFTALAQSQLPPGRYRALPAWSDGRLLVRATRSPTSATVHCIRLARDTSAVGTP
ncbi:MAG: Pyrrolo-quinoline quinone [Planctomycetota bacterium]|nr:MAG: Pyrrolo-quinoline quinone [Planctomycetota bacterium]